MDVFIATYEMENIVFFSHQVTYLPVRSQLIAIEDAILELLQKVDDLKIVKEIARERMPTKIKFQVALEVTLLLHS